MRDQGIFADSIRVKKKQDEERQIVSQILAGDEKALNYFYRHYYHSIYTYISRKINEKEDIEEILQDSFFAVLDGFRDFAFKCSLFTFLCSIANHKIIDFYRKKKIKKIVFSQVKEVEPLLSSLFGPEEALDEQLLRQKIKQTFAKLSPSYQLILKLKYIQGFTVEEISQKMTITFKSAESQLFRARKAFAFVFNYEK
ncbi:hypothetical protein A2W14_05530 [Candidatus Gottesmanbacteria bacterium RBG_16_37_8]|uniref:RNA polymerase sigma factor n=1 Tax=Candidatus Gottesmanbacteria bacterium RBG_16_37_8 TaxID=1798371 RepID=A0A1F5YUK1_9BACT|nr:MAG: hypothetical protein A2W14_05530 [Candidatus Gottesmanbacteria bacterium RBG_16_37_8]